MKRKYFNIKKVASFKSQATNRIIPRVTLTGKQLELIGLKPKDFIEIEIIDNELIVRKHGDLK